jgi:hypothetical protein
MSETFVIPKRKAAAILAGLRILQTHADGGYDAPWLLEVGEVFTDCEPLSSVEIEELCGVFAEAFADQS